jgi:hypothetical protein
MSPVATINRRILFEDIQVGDRVILASLIDSTEVHRVLVERVFEGPATRSRIPGWERVAYFQTIVAGRNGVVYDSHTEEVQLPNGTWHPVTQMWGVHRAVGTAADALQHDIQTVRRGDPGEDSDRRPYLEALEFLIAAAAGSRETVLH